MYKFKMSIGDWSDDGHGKHRDFLISSNASVDVVREAHYKIETATGINIEDICSEYGEGQIDLDMAEKIKSLGFECKESDYEEDGVYISHSDMARLWVFLLERTNPMLELQIIDDDTPTLHFYGYDEYGRHIGHVGYGLF